MFIDPEMTAVSWLYDMAHVLVQRERQNGVTSTTLSLDEYEEGIHSM